MPPWQMPSIRWPPTSNAPFEGNLGKGHQQAPDEGDSYKEHKQIRCWTALQALGEWEKEADGVELPEPEEHGGRVAAARDQGGGQSTRYRIVNEREIHARWTISSSRTTTRPSTSKDG